MATGSNAEPRFYYGVGQGVCPRCKNKYGVHQIEGISLDSATEDTVSKVIGATKAMRGPSVTLKAMLGLAGASGDDDDERMVGALLAVTSLGEEIKIVALSGVDQTPAGVHGWYTADVPVPGTTQGWIDVYGNRFDFPNNMGNGVARKPCAAIKMLLKLGTLFRENSGKYKGYSSISMYESFVTDKERKRDRKGRPRRRLVFTQRPQNVIDTYQEGFDMAAEASCDECNARIPMMLCSRSR